MEKLGLSIIIGASISNSVGHALNSIKKNVKDTETISNNTVIGKSWSEKLIEIGKKFDSLKQKVLEIGNTIRKVDSDAEKLAKKEINQSNFDKAKMRAVEAAGGIYLLKNAIDSVTSPAIEFSKSMSMVSTIVDTSKVNMKALSADARRVGVEFGIAAPQIGDAMYQAISAGIEAEKAGEFMRVAAQSAIGGGTNIKTAVDGMTSVINAYGSSVMSAQEASDIMFMTTVKGKTTFEELSRTIYNVTPIASSLGVKFSEVGAAISTLTASGTPTSVATTQIRQMLAELAQESTRVSKMFKELTGKSFKDFIASGGNVKDALNIIADAAKKDGKELVDVFGSIEAGQAAMGLTGKNAQKFSEDLKSIGEAAGSTKSAFEKMAEDPAFKMEMMKTKLNDVAIGLGTTLLPVVMGVGDVFGTVAQGIGIISEKCPFLTNALLAAAGAFAIIKTVTVGAALASAAWNAILLANPITLVAGAIIGGALLIYKYWEPIKDFFASIFDKVAAVGSAVSRFFGGKTEIKSAQTVKISEQPTEKIKTLATVPDLGALPKQTVPNLGTLPKQTVPNLGTLPKQTVPNLGTISAKLPDIAAPKTQKQQTITQSFNININAPSIDKNSIQELTKTVMAEIKKAAENKKTGGYADASYAW